MTAEWMPKAIDAREAELAALRQRVAELKAEREHDGEMADAYMVEMASLRANAAIGAWVRACTIHPERDPLHNLPAVTHPDVEGYFVAAAGIIKTAIAITTTSTPQEQP